MSNIDKKWKWTEKQIEILINEVKTHPMIYDSEDLNYRNPDKVEKCWIAIDSKLKKPRKF